MTNYNKVLEIYGRNCGSERIFKRQFFENLIYTEGIMDFQQNLNAFWVVDNVITYMTHVIKAFKATEDTFYIVKIRLNKEKQGYMEVYHEGFVDNEYKEHISVVKQKIPYIDLPIKSDKAVTTYKFYLQLANYEPLQFMLMLPSEY